MDADVKSEIDRIWLNLGDDIQKQGIAILRLQAKVAAFESILTALAATAFSDEQKTIMQSFRQCELAEAEKLTKVLRSASSAI